MGSILSGRCVGEEGPLGVTSMEYYASLVHVCETLWHSRYVWYLYPHSGSEVEAIC